MTSQTTQHLCIGSVLWDIIGRTDRDMRVGHDVAGHITRLPGGVAYNIAQELVRLHLRPTLLTSVGNDVAGRDLIAHCAAMGMITDHIHISDHFKTDTYMAIEASNGLIAAIADAHSLEQVGDAILAPMSDGSLGSETAPFRGIAIVDGNLTSELLTQVAHSPLFAKSDLRIVPASPGKAHRLSAFFGVRGVTFYVNRIEAEILCGAKFATSAEAAVALVEKGAARAIVTDGDAPASDATQDKDVISANVPKVDHVKRVTGAGDTLVAAHIQAEITGDTRFDALTHAVTAASRYVAGQEDLDV